MLIVKSRTPNSARPAGARNRYLRALKALRQDDAKVRNARWNALTPQQQLEELSKRPGSCRKQRERILAVIEGQQP